MPLARGGMKPARILYLLPCKKVFAPCVTIFSSDQTKVCSWANGILHGSKFVNDFNKMFHALLALSLRMSLLPESLDFFGSHRNILSKTFGAFFSNEIVFLVAQTSEVAPFLQFVIVDEVCEAAFCLPVVY